MESQIRPVQRIHPCLRDSGVAAFAPEGDLFVQAAVVVVIAEAVGDVVHERHIHVVEHALTDQLGFSGDGADFSLLHQFFAVRHFDHLLRRCGNEGDLPAERIQHAGLQQPGRHPDKGRRTAVVSAGMSSAGNRITFRVIGQHQTVHLPQKRHSGTGSAGIDVGTEPGHGESCPDFQPQRPEFFHQISRGLHLPVARFGIFPDMFANGNEFCTCFFHGVAYRRAHFIKRFHKILLLGFCFCTLRYNSTSQVRCKKKSHIFYLNYTGKCDILS